MCCFIHYSMFFTWVPASELNGCDDPRSKPNLISYQSWDIDSESCFHFWLVPLTLTQTALIICWSLCISCNLANHSPKWSGLLRLIYNCSTWDDPGGKILTCKNFSTIFRHSVASIAQPLPKGSQNRSATIFHTKRSIIFHGNAASV